MGMATIPRAAVGPGRRVDGVPVLGGVEAVEEQRVGLLLDRDDDLVGLPIEVADGHGDVVLGRLGLAGRRQRVLREVVA
jgi:hypothetical protein